MISTSEVLKRYHGAVPRYTSYPTAPQFSPGQGPALAQEMLESLDGHDPCPSMSMFRFAIGFAGSAAATPNTQIAISPLKTIWAMWSKNSRY